jgi:hypothetical protein
MKLINFNNELYQLKRTFKIDSWFGQAVDKFPIEEILSEYHVDKLLRGNDGLYYLVNQIKDVEFIEYILKENTI